MEGKIYCVILNWNGKKFLKNCLDSVLSSSYKKLKVVLVDNASTDGSVDFVEKNYKKVIVLKNRANLGWTGGNNRGVKFALKQGADAVFILNNDTTISANCILNLAKTLFSDKSTGIVGPKIYFSDKGRRTKKISFAGGKFTSNRYFGVHIGINRIDKGQYSKTKKTDFITGAAICVKREVFESVGLFDDRYFIYYDEADFCMKARRKGFTSIFVPAAVVYHEFSGTVSVNSPFQRYYTTRNHYLFVEQNAPFKVKARELLRTPKTALEFFRKDKDKYSLLGIRDYYLRLFGKRRYW